MNRNAETVERVERERERELYTQEMDEPPLAFYCVKKFEEVR